MLTPSYVIHETVEKDDGVAGEVVRPDVLVVDDDEEFLSAILPALRANDMNVDVARTPAEACQLVSRKTYSVVSLGLLLKAGSGFAVIDCIGRLDQRPNVVVITAADPSMLGRIDRSIVKTILFKPINPEQVGAYMHVLAAA